LGKLGKNFEKRHIGSDPHRFWLFSSSRQISNGVSGKKGDKMKCFNHPESDAVGICKNCSKGICHECAVDIGKGIACKDTCVDDVKAINALIQNNRKTYSSMKPRSFIFPIFFMIIGLIFMIQGFNSGKIDFAFYMGICFIAFSIISLIANAKYLNKLK
jgi:hypothetical protein